jgi:hypothetical protein
VRHSPRWLIERGDIRDVDVASRAAAVVKGDVLAIGRVARHARLPGHVRHREHRRGIATLGVDDVDLVAVATIHDAHDLRAVGRPERMGVEPGVVREPSHPGPVDVHHIQIDRSAAFAYEDHACPVGRQPRLRALRLERGGIS